MIDQALSDVYLWLGFEPFTWFFFFVALTVGDGILTAYALRNGASEANAVMKFVMAKIGVIPALILIKTIGISAIYGGLQSIILYMPLLVLLYAGVCGWNVWVINRRLK